MPHCVCKMHKQSAHGHDAGIDDGSSRWNMDAVDGIADGGRVHKNTERAR